MFDGRDPLYRQIGEQLRSDVLRGTLAEGDQVMSTTQYATTYRINPATAAKAFAELVDDGVLEVRRGIGTFVRAGARESLRSGRAATFVTDVLDPVLDQALDLGLDRDAVVGHVRTRLGIPEGAGR